MEVLQKMILAVVPARKILNYVNNGYSSSLASPFFKQSHHFVHKSHSFPLTLPWKSWLLTAIGQLGGSTQPFLGSGFFVAQRTDLY